MAYIVLETWLGADQAAICTDEGGNNLVFDEYSAAEIVAMDCQKGLVVEIPQT